jgi:hypothetical protein
MAQMRRPWTDEVVTKLLNMAQKYPTAQIASEIGRPIPSVREKGPRTGYLFANGSLRTTDNRSSASRLEMPAAS